MRSTVSLGLATPPGGRANEGLAVQFLRSQERDVLMDDAVARRSVPIEQARGILSWECLAGLVPARCAPPVSRPCRLDHEASCRLFPSNRGRHLQCAGLVGVKLLEDPPGDALVRSTLKGERLRVLAPELRKAVLGFGSAPGLGKKASQP